MKGTMIMGSTDIKLKPCPFCGSKADLIIAPGYFNNGQSSAWVVKCKNNCACQMPQKSENDAVKMWNRRVDDQWISVKKALPPFCKYVYVAIKESPSSHSRYTDLGFLAGDDDWRVLDEENGITYLIDEETVTHWMPLPDLPEDEEDV